MRHKSWRIDIARVNLNQIRNGFLNRSHLRSLTTSTTQLSKSRIFIDDTPGISIQKLQSNARRLQAQNQLDLIVIDNLQLMRSETKRGTETRQIEVSEVSSGIKILVIVAPPLAVLLCGKPIQAVLNLLLTLCFWIPGMVHALFVVNSHLGDERAEKMIAAVKQETMRFIKG